METSSKKIIEVSRKGNSYKIKLKELNTGKDNSIKDIETDVDTNDTVIWRLAENSGLDSLEGVYTNNKGEEEENFAKVLVGNPIKRESENGQIYFEGTVVGISPGVHKFQPYMIGFKVPEDDNLYWEDPKLKMHS